jgi:hypothetical protein
MKFNYLTDDNERCLAPFFSEAMIAVALYGIFAIAALLVICWPQKSFFSYVHTGTIPILFFLVFSVTLIINAYVNLRCGRGEMNKKINFYNEVSEKENDYLTYGLIEFLLHTLFMMLPYLPLLLLAASISGISALNVIKAVSIIFAASLFCRMFAFVIYIFEGRASWAGYLLVRAFFILFLFGISAFVPKLSPFQILYGINTGLSGIDVLYHKSYFLYMAVVLSAVFLITVVTQIKIKRHINKER